MINNTLWFFAEYKQADAFKEEEQVMTNLQMKHGNDVNKIDFQSGESVLQTAARYKLYLSGVMRRGRLKKFLIINLLLEIMEAIVINIAVGRGVALRVTISIYLN